MQSKTVEPIIETKVADTEQLPLIKIFDEKWELKDKKVKALTSHIIKVWTKRFCKDSETIEIEKTNTELSMVTTSIDAWLDFCIMWHNIEVNGFPRMSSNLGD